jgi:CHASE2 domain-containing sensor protein
LALIETMARGDFAMSNSKQALRTGIVVMIILAVLTALEYGLGLFTAGWWLPLILLALLKAYFVLRDYMHIARLWTADEEEH